MESILENPTMRMMYEDALMDLSNGYVNPIDRDVLSFAPLPDSIIDPYVSQELQAKSAMSMTYSSLSVWIEEAKKASYFSKHFVTLSRLINGGVATMARGLVTLHVNGEDLSEAPMSIQDLIMVGSYHIRKSYLGVLQTSRSNPEIGERLLLNQLNWTNTLMRLFKTKEKLAKPVSGVRIQDSGDRDALKDAACDVQRLANASQRAAADDTSALVCQVSNVNAQLPADGGEKSALAVDSCFDDVRSAAGFADDGIKELPALTEPCAYGAARAFTAFTSKGSAGSVPSWDSLHTSEIAQQDSPAKGQSRMKQGSVPSSDSPHNPETISKDEQLPEENETPETAKAETEIPEEENPREQDDFPDDEDFEDEDDILRFCEKINSIYEPIPIPIPGVPGSSGRPDTS